MRPRAPKFRKVGAIETRHPLLGKTTLTLVVMLAALAVPYGSPKLRALRVVPAPWDRVAPQETAQGATVPAASSGAQELRASENTPTVTNALPAEATASHKLEIDPAIEARLARDVRVEDPTGHALDAFYASLAKTANKEPGAITRVLHYGDSVIASDYISGTMRRRMQERFGDAGHGFVLIAKAWQWYFHNDVVMWGSDGWQASRISSPWAPDGIMGVGGVSFSGYQGTMAYLGTADKGDYGRKVSRFDIYYLQQTKGGNLDIQVKGRPIETLSTRGDTQVSRVYSVKVPDGPASMNIRAKGPVRLFGVALERDVPGVVYDALGAHAAMVQYWVHQNTEHWKEQLELRKPALVVFQYGTNESDLWKLDLDDYEKTYGVVLDKLKTALAGVGASILVMAPLDRAERGPNGDLVSKQVILKLREIQRRVALERGLAFYDTWRAMGGEGSMGKWFKTVPQLAGGDLTHPTPLGAELLGDLFYDALVAGFEASQHHP